METYSILTERARDVQSFKNVTLRLLFLLGQKLFGALEKIIYKNIFIDDGEDGKFQ
jgi:hypothetical protein